MAKDNSKVKVSLIILTINSLDMIKSELNDISKLDLTGLNLNCVIVDNGSTDGTSEFFKKFKFKNIPLKYIETNSNLGFAGGNNVGIKYSLENGADYCLLLNNDMILQKDLVIRLVDFMKNNPKAGLVSPKIYFAKGYEFHKDRYSKDDLGKVIWYAGGKIDWNNIYTSHRGVDEIDKGQFNESIETELCSGACVLVKSELFKKVGLLDEELFLYWEDADLSIRASKAGYKIYYCPDSIVWHKVSVSAGGSGGGLNDYFLTRNRFFFTVKYAKIRTKFAVLRDTIMLSVNGREWQRKGAIDALLGKKGIGSWKK